MEPDVQVASARYHRDRVPVPANPESGFAENSEGEGASDGCSPQREGWGQRNRIIPEVKAERKISPTQHRSDLIGRYREMHALLASCQTEKNPFSTLWIKCTGHSMNIPVILNG
ncbi:hypothetical protein CEXT_296181 [Caerostris extrusa]|uniref:Uncharacterized protein n=1 Tax=Caerostris extrusa TaxID=172846 RepID=A0AAV4X098_CAEEX|nr:hypothetical protein CEXT_296181 [Caerostris extrusa]